MKRSELFFSAIQVPIDFIMIVLASISAYAIRDIPQIIALKPKLYNFPFDAYIKIILIITPLFLIVYAFEGLYKIKVTRKFWQEFSRVFVATSLVLVIIIITIFLKREWFSSRFIMLAGWILITLYVSFSRYLMQSIQKFILVKKGIGVHRVLLVGSSIKIDHTKKVIQDTPQLGYKIIGRLEYAILKEIKKIKEIKGVDEIILCDPSITDDQQEKLVDYCAINNIVLRYIPTTLQTSRLEIRMINGEPMLEVMNTPLEGWGKIVKRIFDIISSSILIVLSSPIMVIVAILIKIEDGSGPIVYKNERIGDNGKKFFVYKFRYMQWKYCINKNNPNFKEALEFEKKLIEEKNTRKGPIYKIKNDPRKTKVGGFVEKYSLDELPQFFNVLKGDMSLVGPRPHQEREVQKYQEYHRRLLTIKPGVTGMAQVSGRSDLQFEDEYKFDLFYIENWSLWLDIAICFKTLKVLFKRRKNN